MIGLRTNVRSEVALDCVKFFSSCRLKSLLEPRDGERTLSEVAISLHIPDGLWSRSPRFRGLLVRPRSASHFARHGQMFQGSGFDLDCTQPCRQERPNRHTKAHRMTTDRGGRDRKLRWITWRWPDACQLRIRQAELNASHIHKDGRNFRKRMAILNARFF